MSFILTYLWPPAKPCLPWRSDYMWLCFSIKPSIAPYRWQDTNKCVARDWKDPNMAGWWWHPKICHCHNSCECSLVIKDFTMTRLSWVTWVSLMSSHLQERWKEIRQHTAEKVLGPQRQRPEWCSHRSGFPPSASRVSAAVLTSWCQWNWLRSSGLQNHENTFSMF